MTEKQLEASLVELQREADEWYRISETSGPLESRELAHGIEIAIRRIRQAMALAKNPPKKD